MCVALPLCGDACAFQRAMVWPPYEFPCYALFSIHYSLCHTYQYSHLYSETCRVFSCSRARNQISQVCSTLQICNLKAACGILICKGGWCLHVADSSSDFSSDSSDSDDAKKKHPKDLKSIQETNRLVFWLCCTHVCGILHSKPKVCYRHQN